MLVVGQEASLTGDITRLNWIAGRSPADIERSVGYEAGRLSGGYWVALLKEPLRANHVRFAGLTLRSGGREGAPLHDPALDRQRTHVHDRMLQDYTPAGVDKLLARLAADPRNLLGDERIVKIVPMQRSPGTDPAKEYPMGGGGPQHTLVEAHKFLIAVEVNASAVALTAAGWSVSIAPGAPYDNRARLARYLQTVKG